eukprot:gnl/TRDRNA2_/TRDRNA2_84723_c0_seq1.p2 gnl/TRDRNA2_/TRDRNA2_84723_c0~~gnl/TRDRNA2_/TRDRNA2_84723_c0_seq1.p2  ORF type:complete len:164 (+),score=26.78 gnl/TRDRNA2_/TRDRNA2_84723_c0_seq1:61-552(+)
MYSTCPVVSVASLAAVAPIWPLFAGAPASQVERLSVETVKEEFKEHFGHHASQLLCSGCLLVASRLDAELDARDLNTVKGGVPSGELHDASKVACDAACGGYPKRLLVSSASKHRMHFIADEARANEALPDAASHESYAKNRGMVKRLCSALMAKFSQELLPT